MALDTTVAGDAADSYVTLEEADALASADFGPFAEKWTTLTDDAKERALRRATVDIDSTYGTVIRYAATQSRSFPRVTDVLALAPFVPDGIKQATYEQAIYLAANKKALDDAASRRARGLISFSDADGSGSMVASDPQFGRIAPEASRWLAVVRGHARSGRSIVSVPVRSASYPE